MLRAALKLIIREPCHEVPPSPDTHNAACGIDSKTALRVLSVTQSRFRMQKAHSNLDDAAHRCVRIEIQKGTVERSPPLLAEIPPPRFAAQSGVISFIVLQI